MRLPSESYAWEPAGLYEPVGLRSDAYEVVVGLRSDAYELRREEPEYEPRRALEYSE